LEVSDAFEGVGRNDWVFLEAVEGDCFRFEYAGGVVVSRGDAAGVRLRLCMGLFLDESVVESRFASGCNEVILDRNAGAGLRLNFEVGGPIEYFLVEA
jgi:hypothetical protein